jgi:beta-ureidopropionase / N-carbamoyl-L-amino-acid hydrolase
MNTALPDRFRALWASLAPIGRSEETGGYLRYAWTSADLECREWFVEEALDRDLAIDTDGNGNMWATWLPDGVPADAKAVVTGSHLDSVPHGGGYDGPLGVVTALLAVDEMRARGVRPRKPLKIAVFTEEEGSRFGVACLGSRLATGAIDPAKALALTDRDGTSLAEAMEHAGLDPAKAGRIGVESIDAFIELHVEQGRWLAETSQPVGVASAIWPHGRWRFDFTGEGNHAGTTRMEHRHDPMLTFAFTVLAANKEARMVGAHATVGRVSVEPNATNAIPTSVAAWLDARAADSVTLDELVATIEAKAAERASRDGTTLRVAAESVTGETSFATELLDIVTGVMPDAPLLPTAAGHDAGVLANHVPTAMLFVRNPTGVSHAPSEFASDEDCAAGVAALADVLTELTR